MWIMIDGIVWEVELDMVGEIVILLWGLFDEEMYVEFIGEIWGFYYLVLGFVLLYCYWMFRCGKVVEWVDCIYVLVR